MIVHSISGAAAGLALSLAVGLSVGGCSTGSTAEAAPTRAAPVRVAKAEKKDVPLTVEAYGTVEANSTVAVAAQVSGLVTEVHFKEGALVEKGEPLFTVDSRPYQASLAMAAAELARNKTAAEQARSEAVRAEKLAKAGVASEQQLEASRAAAKTAEAAVKLARAQAASARLKVGFSRILAPISGHTGALQVHAGNLVTDSDPNPLVTIRSVSPALVRFTVAERYAGRVRRGQAEGGLRVRVTPRGDKSKPIEGPLTFVDNSVDMATGTLALKATFDNADKTLWPGEAVRVELILGVDKGALVVPDAAVQQGQKGTYTYVVDGNQRAQLRQLVVARTTGGLAVIDKGLEPGDVVVTDGQVRLRDGAAVEIERK